MSTGKLFSASTKDWTAKAKRNFTMVHRRAVQKLYNAVVEDTPIKTGNARRSWWFSTTAMPQVDSALLGYLPPGDIGLSIATLPPGSPVYIGAQAIYMPRLNYGFTGTDSIGRSYNQAGLLFIERNAAMWQDFVNAAAREIGGVN